MAIKLSDQYPGRANPPSVDYPNGSIKNRSAPGVLDGTPLDQAWANDKEGFFQGILAEAEITADGQPDKVGASQYLQALKSVVKKEAPKSTQPIQGSFKNLKSSATGTNSFISVSLDQCILEDESVGTIKISGVNLIIDSSTSGLGGLDSGSITSNTWYSVWVVSNGVNVGGLISLSATAPTLPLGYSYKARTGWIKTDSTANKFPLAFGQSDDVVEVRIAPDTNRTSAPLLISGVQGNPSLAAPIMVPANVDAYIPITAAAIKITLYAYLSGSSAIAAPSNTYYGATSTPIGASPLHLSQGGSAASASVTGEFLLQSRNIYYASQATYSGAAVFGWSDSL